MDLEDHIGKWTIIETVNSHSRYHGFLTCVDEKGVTLRRRESDGLSFIPWDNVKQVEVFPLHSINDAKPQSKAGYNYYKALNHWLDKRQEQVPADEKRPKDVVVGYNYYVSHNYGPVDHMAYIPVDKPTFPTVTYSDGKDPTPPWKDLDTGELIEMLSQRPSVAKIYDIPEGSTVKCAPLLSKSWQEYLNNPAAPRIIIDGPARIVVVKK